MLDVTEVEFWLQTQFSRSMRMRRQAKESPIGRVDDVVMLHSKPKPDLHLLDVMPLTRNLGKMVADVTDTFVRTDASDERLRVEFSQDRFNAFALKRIAEPLPAS